MRMQHGEVVVLIYLGFVINNSLKGMIYAM